MHHVGTFLNEMIMGMPDTIEELFAYVLERLEIDMREYTTELYQNQLKMSTAERIMSKARGGVDPKRDLSVQGAAAKWKSKKHNLGETSDGSNASVTGSATGSAVWCACLAGWWWWLWGCGRVGGGEGSFLREPQETENCFQTNFASIDRHFRFQRTLSREFSEST